jgi:MFS family permease
LREIESVLPVLENAYPVTEQSASAEAPVFNPRPLMTLLAASFVSNMGNALTIVALPWFVLDTTGSASQAGLVGFAQVLPAFLAGLFGGTLVDRFGYRSMSVISDLVSGVSIVAIPLLYHTIGLQFWQLLVLVFTGAMLDIPGLTARRAMMPELATLGNVPLARANAWFEAAQYISLLLGPPVAGLLITAVGTANVLWIDAGSFLISALMIAIAIPPAVRVVRRAHERKRDELLAGLRFIRHDRVLFWMAIILAASNLLTGPMFAVILPVFVKETTNRASDLGIILAAGGIGALIGSLLYGSIGIRMSRRALWIGTFLVSPLEFWILAADLPFWWLVPGAVLAGIAIGPINPLMVTIRHERSPAELRGRVFASYSAIAMVAQPLGMVAVGGAIEEFGLHPTLLVIAVSAQLLGISLFFIPAFRDLDPAHPQPVRPIEPS